MPSFHNIKEDAIFIADAHYNKNRIEFDLFLDKIIQKEIKTSQLILMGDIFDFLAYEIDYFKNINESVINKINHISHSIDIVYIEGNHDYNLQKLFKHTFVIPREQQSIKVSLNNQNIIIAHGDIYTPFLYNIYTKFIRNSMVLKFLNYININNIISKIVENKLIKKDICHDFKNFENFAKSRIKKYNLSNDSILIEGHFHQGKSYNNYINIPSFACSNEYTQVKNKKFVNIKFIK